MTGSRVRRRLFQGGGESPQEPRCSVRFSSAQRDPKWPLDLEGLRERLRYQQSIIDREQMRSVKLTNTLSDTLRELAERKDKYLSCSAELARSLETQRVLSRESKKARKEARALEGQMQALIGCLKLNAQEACALASQLIAEEARVQVNLPKSRAHHDLLLEGSESSPALKDELMSESFLKCDGLLSELERNLAQLREQEGHRESERAREWQERQRALDEETHHAAKMAEELHSAQKTAQERVTEQEAARAHVALERDTLITRLKQRDAELSACKERLRLLQDEFASLAREAAGATNTLAHTHATRAHTHTREDDGGDGALAREAAGAQTTFEDR